MNLKNRIVVITGGSKGLGKALALCFLKEGSKIVVCSKNEEEPKNLENGIVGIKADVTKENDMKNLANFAMKKFGQIDIWINNVGTGMGHLPIEKVDSKQAHEVMDVNFFGTFYGSRSVMKYMKKKKSGVIINIISSRALVPSPFSAVYSSSKWAVRGFTKLLREALREYKIFVIAAYPSGMKTNFFGKAKPADYKDYMEPEFVAEKIVQNLKQSKPKDELIIKK